MQSELHDKARFLLDQTGISPSEQRWLAEHLAQCADCSCYAELSRRAVSALDSIAFDIDSAALSRVQQAVLRRAEQQRRPGVSPAATAAAILLTILGSAALWQPLAWLASRSHWPEPHWQFAFLAAWVLPSILLDVLLVFAAAAGGEEQQ